MLLFGISKAPNGIVIDLSTGKPDPVRSAIQARRLGIDRDGNYVQNRDPHQEIDNVFQEMLDKNKKIDIRVNEKYNPDNWAQNLLNDMNNNKVYNNAMKDIMKEMDDKNFSESFNEEVNEALTEINAKDPIVMRFAILVDEMNKHPGTNENEINSLIEKYPEYRDRFSQMIEKGIDSIEVDKYKNYVSKKFLAEAIQEVENMNKNELESMDESDRKYIIEMAISAMNMTASPEFLNKVESMVKKVDPDIDSLSNFEKIAEKCVPFGKFVENSTVDIYDLAKEFRMEIGELKQSNIPLGEMAKKVGMRPEELLKRLGIDADTTQQIVVDLGMELQRASAKNVSKHIVNEKERGKKSNESLNFKNAAETQNELYFKDSKIPFSKLDDTVMKIINLSSRSVSWIESKEEVTDLEYLSLINRKEQLIDKQEKIKNNADIRLEIKKIEKSIKEFEDSHTGLDKEKYFKENGKLNSELKKRINTFEAVKFRGDILCDFIEDENKVQSLQNYINLSKQDKTKYLRDTLYGLADKRPMMEKMAMRRLEIISTSEKNFLIFDENGEPQVNTELLLQECEKIGIVNDENKDILYNNDTYIKERTKYVTDKLKKYEKLPDECFVKIETKEGKKMEVLEDRVRQIDQIKLKNKLRVSTQVKLSQEEIDKLIQKTQAEKERKQEPQEVSTQENNPNRILSQEEIDELIKKTQAEKENKQEPQTLSEQLASAFTKGAKDFEDKMLEISRQSPEEAQAFLKESLRDPEKQLNPIFGQKILILENSITQAINEKLKDAFTKDDGRFEESIKKMISLNPDKSQAFLGSLSPKDKEGITNYAEKEKMLRDMVTKQKIKDVFERNSNNFKDIVRENPEAAKEFLKEAFISGEKQFDAAETSNVLGLQAAIKEVENENRPIMENNILSAEKADISAIRGDASIASRSKDNSSSGKSKDSSANNPSPKQVDDDEPSL